MTTARKPLIAGNWKMFHGGPSGCDLAAAIAAGCRGPGAGAGLLDRIDLVVAPPFTALAAVAHELSATAVGVAAQNMHPSAEGAFTGEVSASMLLDAGCSWVILGHSERRQLFCETDTSVHAKVGAAIQARLRPIVCVGETLAEREAGETLAVVHRQVDAFVETIAGEPGYAAIAYEPVWAIGTGKVAGPDQAQEVHAAIRARLGATSSELAAGTRILYGGSVKPGNAAGLLSCRDIDGALVGGASLDATSFLEIARAAC